ncbi:hypothetical protein Tco_1450953 [Tanacetum coccineum]
MVINSPCLTDKKELAIPGQTTTGKEFSNSLMADSLPKTILPTKIIREKVNTVWQTASDETGEHVPLFDSMLIHDQPGQGERPTLTVESQHIPIASPTTSQPTTSQPMSSQEQPSQTKKVYGKALTKLVKKVKHLEDKLRSTTESRKSRMVISDDEEDLVSEDPSKQGRMTETEYEDVNVETEYEEVDCKFDQTDTLQQITPTKVPQGVEQNQESSEVQLDVLSAVKILAEASR